MAMICLLHFWTAKTAKNKYCSFGYRTAGCVVDREEAARPYFDSAATVYLAHRAQLFTYLKMESSAWSDTDDSHEAHKNIFLEVLAVLEV